VLNHKIIHKIRETIDLNYYLKLYKYLIFINCNYILNILFNNVLRIIIPIIFGIKLNNLISYKPLGIIKR